MALTEHEPFTLVLAGGGARGFAHVGVLRALEDEGLRPGALVGVSMGALVAATYSARKDWYHALTTMETGGFPQPMHGLTEGDRGPALRRAVEYLHAAWNMITGWGAPPEAIEAGREVLEGLLAELRLEAGRVPVAICATDLVTGTRVTFRSGDAVRAVYASAALAGVVPPLRMGHQLLADGAYTDVAPVDVARGLGCPTVVVVDPSQSSGTSNVGNGLQSVMRAMEICHLRHAELSMRAADLVIRPAFERVIDVLDFGARDECVRAGLEAVAQRRDDIRSALEARVSA